VQEQGNAISGNYQLAVETLNATAPEPSTLVLLAVSMGYLAIGRLPRPRIGTRLLANHGHLVWGVFTQVAPLTVRGIGRFWMYNWNGASGDSAPPSLGTSILYAFPTVQRIRFRAAHGSRSEISRHRRSAK
jgi:hypothetical protein